MAGKRKIRCVETGEVFNSIKEASDFIGKNPATVRACCKDNKHTAGGYHWEYIGVDDINGEIWKWAVCVTNGVRYDFTGQVKCSNMGRVKDVVKDRLYSPFVKNPENEYLYVSINGVEHRLHRVICFSFIPNPENKTTVDHINGIRTDNRVENLRWFTPKEQINDNEHTRTNLKKAHAKRCKKVKCITTGEIFNSVKDAEMHYNIANISACCNKNRNYSGILDDGTPLEWQFFDEDDK